MRVEADHASARHLLRLMAWMSPAFPVGSFSYSYGLERAVQGGLVSNAVELREWIEQLLRHGSGWNDAVLFAESWRRAGDSSDVAQLAQLAEALAGSRERHMETTLQGTAFLKAAESWPIRVSEYLHNGAPYCVAVGAYCGFHSIPLHDALAAYLQAFGSNMIQAAIRLGVLGQQNAVATLAALEPVITEVAGCAADSTLEDLGACTVLSDTMAMRHETQYSRLFRS